MVSYSWMSSRVVLVPLLLLPILGTRCLNDRLLGTQGTLKVIVDNPPSNAATLDVTAHSERVTTSLTAGTQTPETVVEMKGLEAGLYAVRVVARDAAGLPLSAVWISDVFIHEEQTTEVRVDLANGIPASAEICDGKDNDSDGRVDEPLDMPLCSTCLQGFEQPLPDDDRCGIMSCAGLDAQELRGDNTAAGSSQCVHVAHGPITSHRCQEIGHCVGVTPLTCTQKEETVLATAGVCEIINRCEAGNPTVERVPDGTACGLNLTCQQGRCTPVGCDPLVTAPVCHQCVAGSSGVVEDDARCGVLVCSGLNRVELRGDNTVTGSSQCVRLAFGDVTAHRCTAAGVCKAANDPAECGPATETVLAQAGMCHTLENCVTGNPVVRTAVDETPCGISKVCRSGACVDACDPAQVPVCHQCVNGQDANQPDGTPCGGPNTCQHGTCVGVDPNHGCADGTREGFLNVTTYPAIAACSGAWSLGGVTRPTLVPTCGRAAGNQGSNVEGTGCSSADLCAVGWHVCVGRQEVGLRAPAGCADAVPAGAPDKAYFFAVAQHSSNNTMCDDAGGDNDVFGCGNLGVLLTADKGCGPLTRALASTRPNTCGYNEAEPTLGPWQCPGGPGGDIHEGSSVIKNGCPNVSCTYGGTPVGNSDKGGVLCCMD